jgi:hypothetical protein
VSIERIFYCDAPECEAHTRTIAGRPGMGFVTVTVDGPARHFCSWDCVLKFGATMPPVETLGGGE